MSGCSFLATYRPTAKTGSGRYAVQCYSLPPFVDGSCRREPDFESRFPSVWHRPNAALSESFPTQPSRPNRSPRPPPPLPNTKRRRAAQPRHHSPNPPYIEPPLALRVASRENAVACGKKRPLPAQRRKRHMSSLAWRRMQFACPMRPVTLNSGAAARPKEAQKVSPCKNYLAETKPPTGFFARPGVSPSGRQSETLFLLRSSHPGRLPFKGRPRPMELDTSTFHNPDILTLLCHRFRFPLSSRACPISLRSLAPGKEPVAHDRR